MKVPVKAVDENISYAGQRKGFFESLKKVARNFAIVGVGSLIIGEGGALLNNHSTEPAAATMAAVASARAQCNPGENYGDMARVKPPRRASDRRGIFFYFGDFDTCNGGIYFGKAFDEIARANFNIALIEAINWQGYANYVSKTGNGKLLVAENRDTFSRVGRGKDPMQELLEQARERNIGVWPWFAMFIGSQQLLEEHPNWAATSAYGRTNKYLDVLNPDVRKYMLATVMQFVGRYGKYIQGVNFDNELPTDHISYSQYDKELFMRENHIHEINWPSDVLQGGRYYGKWTGWVNGIIADFYAEVRREIKKQNRNLVVSMDVTRSPDDYRYYSDWNMLIRRGAVDVVDPMIYWPDERVGVGTVVTQTRHAVELARRDRRDVLVTSDVGGSLQATKGMSGSEWVRGARNAREGGSSGFFVFAKSCLDEEALKSFGRAYRGE